MAQRELTPEEKAARAEALARGRLTAAANRAAKKAAGQAKPAAAGYISPGPAAVPHKDNESRRLRLLEGIDPEIARLITDAELDAIEAEEREKAEAERKKQALATVRTSLRHKARVENDLIAASTLRSEAEKKRLNEPVTFVIDLPEGGAAEGMRVDGFLYQNGHTYTRPRGVAESLKANIFRTWFHEIRFSTLDQHKRGHSAEEIMGRRGIVFEVAA